MNIFLIILIVLAIISFSEMCRELLKWLNSKIDEPTIAFKADHLNKLSTSLKYKEKYLNEHALKVAIIHVKALYVLMCNAVKNNDNKTFDLAIEHLRKYNIPDDILSSMKYMNEFIMDMDKRKVCG